MTHCWHPLLLLLIWFYSLSTFYEAAELENALEKNWKWNHSKEIIDENFVNPREQFSRGQGVDNEMKIRQCPNGRRTEYKQSWTRYLVRSIQKEDPVAPWGEAGKSVRQKKKHLKWKKRKVIPVAFRFFFLPIATLVALYFRINIYSVCGTREPESFIYAPATRAGKLFCRLLCGYALYF